jgi:hypothetical protein
MEAQAKLLNLKLKIEEQQEKFKGKLSHLELHSLKYILGGAGFGDAAGAIGSLIALFTEGFLGASGTIVLGSCCVNPVIAVGVAALGVGLLFTIAGLSATQYLRNSSKENIEKLEQLDSNAAKLLMKMEKLGTLLNSSYPEKVITTLYTINELKDCLNNETQRKGNCVLCDNILKENKEMIELFSKIISFETACNT